MKLTAKVMLWLTLVALLAPGELSPRARALEAGVSTSGTTVPGAFGPVGPARLLDTRVGTGGPAGAVPARGVVAVPVGGRGGVPAAGVSAVALNVTVTGPTAGGYITAYGSGTTRPTASNLNFQTGQTVPNLVIAPVGADGKVALYNGSAGRTHLLADVAGYYLASKPEGSPAIPARFQAAADAIVDAPDLAAGISATAHALELAGATVSADTDVPAGASPAAGVIVLRPQVVALAQDARARDRTGRLTLSELEGALLALGAPETTVSPQGARSLRLFLSSWATTAAAAPDERASAAPLLLAALARRQLPPVDIMAANYLDGDLHLTFLDLELIASGVAQLAPAFRAELPPPPVPQTAPAKSSQGAAMQSQGPCAVAKQTLEDSLPFAGSVWAFAVGQAGGAAVQKYVESLAFYMDLSDPVQAGARFTKLLNALGILMKVQALVTLYSATEATVESLSADPIHKPTELDPDRFLGFQLTAGIPDEDWEAMKKEQLNPEFGQALTECAALLGLPVPTSAQDIGSSVDKWRAEWRLIEGSPKHALFDASSFQLPGHLRNYLTRRNDHSGTDTVPARLTAEKTTDHPGDLVSAPVTVRASVETDQPPNVSLLFQAMQGGVDPFALAGAVADVLAGLFQNLKTIDAYRTVTVQYHVPRKGSVSGRFQTRMDGRLDSPPHPHHSSTEKSSRSDLSYVTDSHLSGASNEVFSWKFSLRRETTGTHARHGRSYVNGGGVCGVEKQAQSSAEGSASASEEASGYLSINYLGEYVVGVDRPFELKVPVTSSGQWTEREYGPTDQGCSNRSFSGSTSSGFTTTLYAPQVNEHSGKVDPKNPGASIQATFTAPGDLVGVSSSLVNYAFNFDGGIPVPPGPPER